MNILSINNLIYCFVQQPSNGLAASATYVCGPSKPTNETFVFQNGLGNVENHPQNGINKQDPAKVNGTGKSKTSYSSIITEDDSDDDIPLQRNPKNHKELFKYVAVNIVYLTDFK